MSFVRVDPSLRVAIEHHRAGRMAEAELIYRQILAANPNDPGALHLLGIMASGRGRLDEAVDLLRKAVDAAPGVGQFHCDLGDALQRHGHVDEAIAAYQQALAIDPNHVAALNNLGLALLAKKEFAPAVASWRRALALRPDFADAHVNLGIAMRQMNRIDDAIACLERGVQLRPDSAEVHNDLGILLHKTGRLDEAVASFERAIKSRPLYALAHTNVGTAWKEKGNMDRAIACYRQALDLDGEHVETHISLAHALLATGSLIQGWNENEWRWKLSGPQRDDEWNWATFGFNDRPDLLRKTWDGSSRSTGTVLLVAEYGFGDAIQFIRYAPLVKERRDHVVVRCHPDLVALLKTMSGIDDVVSRDAPLPAFDAHCTLLSLPRIFATTLETIPSRVPYLKADPIRTAAWAARLGRDRLKIGIAWAGNPHHRNDGARSISPQAFSQLAKIPGIEVVSLQKHPPGNPAQIPAALHLIDHTELMRDFADTAALVANLDLVISVDTAIVHLAGALAKPVWTLLPFVPDWRWMLNRSDSPWYPTMRLFRQPAIGDWTSVFQQVMNELPKWIRSRSTAS